MPGTRKQRKQSAAIRREIANQTSQPTPGRADRTAPPEAAATAAPSPAGPAERTAPAATAEKQPAGGTPARPTLVTSCDGCHRCGMREQLAEQIDDTCRYCDGGPVRVRLYASRKLAKRCMVRYRKRHPYRKLNPQTAAARSRGKADPVESRSNSTPAPAPAEAAHPACSTQRGTR